jgi:hypothetical protein
MCLGAGGAFLGAPLGIYPCNASDPLQAWAYSAASGQLALPGAAAAAAAAPGGGALCAQAGSFTPTCDLPPFSTYPYCNPALPVAARVADLVQRMTPQEQVAALDSGVPAIPRLGVPSFHSGEALHGAACGCVSAPAPNSTGCPTSFPAPIALGAAMDADLWARVGAAIGTEARALANVGPGALWVFAPNLNPSRDVSVVVVVVVVAARAQVPRRALPAPRGPLNPSLHIHTHSSPLTSLAPHTSHCSPGGGARRRCPARTLPCAPAMALPLLLGCRLARATAAHTSWWQPRSSTLLAVRFG